MTHESITLLILSAVSFVNSLGVVACCVSLSRLWRLMASEQEAQWKRISAVADAVSDATAVSAGRYATRDEVRDGLRELKNDLHQLIAAKHGEVVEAIRGSRPK